MLVARPEMMSSFGPIKSGHTWLDVGGGTGRNIHYIRAQLDRFEKIVVLDICPELLAIGEDHARRSFTPSQCDRIEWVCMDINSKNIRSKLSKYLRNDQNRGFDTITFSYSVSMIPEWQKALESARSLMSEDGRVVISDFDTYTEQGNGIKDFMIHTWYKQDSVRIEAKTRQVISRDVFPANRFKVTFARFQRPLAGVKIPHFVGCCRKETMTCSQGLRRPSATNLKDLDDEEKKHD